LIENRAYQRRALVETAEARAQGKRAILLVAPTGAGKTTIAGLAMKGAVSRSMRGAFIAHRRELIEQAAKRFQSFGLEVGYRGLRPGAPVQVTSPHVILARRQMPEAEFVVFDEAHHYVADEWRQILDGYRKAGAHVLGLSATPERGDGIGLGGAFDHLIVVSQIAELTDLGFLVPCDVARPRGGVSRMACEPWEAYLKYAPGRSAVVFAPHVKAAEAFAADFRAHGIDAGVVEGTMAEEDRDRVLARFATGELRVIVNVMVLTEGWDCPIADVCILARLVGSPSLYLQMVGRVLRTLGAAERAAGLVKEAALLIDLCGNRELHGHPAENRIWSLEGAACRRAGQEANPVRLCRSCRNEIPLGEPACPVCLLPLPEQKVPRGEGVDLEIEKREAEKDRKAALPVDTRIRMLAGLYKKGIRKGHQKKAAELAYRSMTKTFPDVALTAKAWRLAQQMIAEEKGDAYEIPLEEVS